MIDDFPAPGRPAMPNLSPGYTAKEISINSHGPFSTVAQGVAFEADCAVFWPRPRRLDLHGVSRFGYNIGVGQVAINSTHIIFNFKGTFDAILRHIIQQLKGVDQ